MFALQRTVTVRYLGQRWTRTVLIVLSIALGVSTLVATQALSETLNQAAGVAANPFTEDVDLLIDRGQTGVPADLVPKLRAVPGVRRVEPLVLTFVLLPKAKPANGEAPDPEQKDRFIQLVGVEFNETTMQDPTAGHSFIDKIEFEGGVSLAQLKDWLQAAESLTKQFKERRWWSQPPGFLEQGVALLGQLGSPSAPPFVLVGSDLAAQLPEEARQSHVFEVQAEDRLSKLCWVGTVYLKPEVQQKLGSRMIFMRLEDAARVAMPGREKNVSRIGVAFADGCDRAAVRRQVEEVVGGKGNVRTVEDSNQSVQDVTNGLRLGFLLGGAGALVVGLFLVYNALSVSVAERRHDIGILRSMGATRGQVGRLFLVEALLLGLTGSLLGLPAGYGLAWVSLKPARGVLEDLFNVTLEANSVPLTGLTVLLALTAGPATAILAALFPAMQAAQEEPADAVRRVPVTVRVLFRVLHVGLAALILVAGLCTIWFRDRLPPRAGAYGGIVCLMVGALVATPILAAGLARLLQPLFRRLLGLEGRLAADNLVRAPGRTGLVIAALAATGALLVQTAGFIRSSEDAIQVWLEDKIAADLFVMSGSSVNAAGLPMRDDVGALIRKHPDVETVVAVRGHQLLYRDRIVYLLALDVDTLLHGTTERPLSRTFREFPRLSEPGTALVSENFAALNHVNVGDTVTVDGPDGKIPLHVIGTIQDYSWNRGTIVVNRAWFVKTFQDDQIDLFDVWLRPGADPNKVAREVREAGEGRRKLLVVVTQQEARDEIIKAIRRLYGLLYVQQFVVGLVALLGVVSALFISVLQRRRELGLLRAVGASRPQILRSVLAEATLMGSIGALIGFVVGLVLEWYVVRILLLDEAGWVFPVRVPWAACAWVFVGSVGLATLVGLWPAYHATRLRIPEAIAYE